MAETTRSPATRNRVPLSLPPDLVEWIDAHASPGGRFGHTSHAVEQAIHRLRMEYRCLQAECGKRGVAFQPVAFWRLHDAAQSEVAARSKRPPGEALRTKVYASVAEELLAWLQRARLEGSSFETVSQPVEAGLRRLQSSRFEFPPGEQADLAPADLWQQYQRAATG